jgi:hypothetical protein
LIVQKAYSLRDGMDLTIGNAGAFPAPIVAGGQVASAIAPVPEPGTLALLAAGAVSAAATMRRRTAQSFSCAATCRRRRFL